MIRLRRPARLPPGDPIIPLVDVAFFLLVFALLVGRMDATAPFEVSPPVSALGATLPQGGATVAVAADGALSLDGTAAQAAEIVAALGAQAAAGTAPFVRINADARAPVSGFLPLVAALEARGVTRIALVVTPPAP